MMRKCYTNNADIRLGIHQAAEIENLKIRLKQYADYDEIKRELGIMKVAKLT
jgi:hypothetical protein